jgi:DNA-binding NtrC family response regulator
MVTAFGSIPSAVESGRHGAIDYLTKPVEAETLLFAVRKALVERNLRDETRALRRAAPDGTADGAAGSASYRSLALRELYALAARVAKQDGNVLFHGESGTGKDRLARWVHEQSRRADGPYFALNCAALSRELAESELFGHEPGAFTGARGRKRGLVELANKGTLLLNEIGELELGLQSKLLTFLDTRSFFRVGGERPIAVDTRIFAATNRDLAREVDRGNFRLDLFYRLNVVPLRLPPLRERREDIPRLIDEIIEAQLVPMGFPIRPTVAPDALAALSAYHWPGNVRELRNVLERAATLSPDGVIRRPQLCLEPVLPDGGGELPVPDGTLDEAVARLTRHLIVNALRTSGSKQEAARRLGLSRHALAYRMQALGLEA